MAKLTVEEIGVHLLARSVMRIQQAQVVVIYVHVGRKAPYERLAYDQRGADALLARRHRAAFFRERWKASSQTKGTRPPRDTAARTRAARQPRDVRVASTRGRKLHGQDPGRTYATKDFLLSFD